MESEDFEKIHEVFEEIKQDEGFSSKVYRCTQGFLTIGFGRNLETKGIDECEAGILLMNDIGQTFDFLNKHYSWFSTLSPVRKRALINMCYNLGETNFQEFKKMIEAFSQENYKVASQEMIQSKWRIQTKNNRAMRLSKMVDEG